MRTYFKVAVAIAVILGLSNGYLLSILSSTHKKVNEFDSHVEEQYKSFNKNVEYSLKQIETATEKALKKINTDLRNVAKKEAKSVATKISNNIGAQSLIRDRALRKWLLHIYLKANAHREGDWANGWWQNEIRTQLNTMKAGTTW